MINIGDKVRFLTETGGGIVKAFKDKNTVIVEGNDGFDIPMLITNVVVVGNTDALNFERKPLKKGNLLLGCDYCDYRAICRMESGGECRNYYDSANAPHGADETEVTDDE